MHIDRRFLNWGVFFIALGAVVLAARQASLPADIRWWELWPLLLIGWGIGLILGRTAFGLLGGVIVAATLGIMVGAILGVGSGIGNVAAACGSGPGTPFAARSGSFGGDRASVELEPGCGTLDVGIGGSGWTVAGSSPNGSQPTIESGPGRLNVHTADVPFGLLGPTGGNAWQVTLPADQTLDLSVTANAGTSQLALANSKVRTLSLTVNAGSTRADFTGTALSSFSVTANAGDARLALPGANISGSITANAGSVAVCVPAGTAIRISSSGVLNGNNFATNGLVQSGDTWASPDYATAQTKIDLSATANVGSVSLNPSGGCR